GRPTPYAQHVAAGLDRRELPAELEDERVDAVVSREKIRPEPDDRNGHRPLPRPGQELGHFLLGLRPGKRARRPTGAQRRVPRELDPLLDGHANASRISGAARSTSPAPSVRIVSPGRAQ